jgi:hypothetical protein
MDGEKSLSVLFVVRVVGALARPLSLRLQARACGTPAPGLSPADSAEGRKLAENESV